MPDLTTSLPTLPFIAGKTSLTPIEARGSRTKRQYFADGSYQEWAVGSKPIKFQLAYTSLNREETARVDAFFDSVGGSARPWRTNHHQNLRSGECYFDTDKIAWTIDGHWASTMLWCRFRQKSKQKG